MKMNHGGNPAPPNVSSAQVRRIWLLAAAALTILLALLRFPPLNETAPAANSAQATAPGGPSASSAARRSGFDHPRFHGVSSAPAPTAEQIVAGKVSQFGRARRDLVRAIARRLQKEVPPEVERFFDAIESGRWEEINARWRELARQSGQYDYSTDAWEELNPFWPAVLDAYGVAEQAHLWPAQELLDYGNTILDSLRPGMVYVGGTDEGRWIPELLNETGDGEPRVILTQNALADARYLEFLNTLYGDRLATLTSEDSQRAFAQYTADAQQRLLHDEQFPDEPRQVRPGEDLKLVDGRVQVSGRAAVMAINETLLQMFMQKNPDLSFALQESFSLPGTYADAMPLGPIMELRAPGGPDAFTAERAAESLDFWRNAAQQLSTESGFTGSESALKSYSHNAMAAANLLSARHFNSEAEQAYRLATQFWPENFEAVSRLAGLLSRSGRANEAGQFVEDYARRYPARREELERLSAAWRLTAPVTSGNP